jgi:hypothetical protein
MAGHKRLSLHGAQRLENHGIPHSPATNMTFQHTLALFFDIHANRPIGVYDHRRLAAMLSTVAVAYRLKRAFELTMSYLVSRPLGTVSVCC